jgi:hypothetical protein
MEYTIKLVKTDKKWKATLSLDNNSVLEQEGKGVVSVLHLLGKEFKNEIKNVKETKKEEEPKTE